jgi:hypothetical protein
MDSSSGHPLSHALQVEGNSNDSARHTQQTDGVPSHAAAAAAAAAAGMRCRGWLETGCCL